MESIKINKLEIENVKRIKAVKIEPTQSGLTVIGGKNNQGKTSVIDSIAWVLGGDKYRPSSAQRNDSDIPPNLHIVMSNGIVIERKGKNSDLKVTDPNGQKGGQQLLNDFVEQLALDLPKFMESTNKEKATTLLQIIGVGDKLTTLEREEMEFYNKRLAIGQIADQKSKFAKEQPYYTDAPNELVSVSELIKQQQNILATNGENQRKRNKLDNLLQKEKDLTLKIIDLQAQLNIVQNDIKTGNKATQDLQDQSTAELESNISNTEEINRKVRANLDKDKAEDDAKLYKEQYDKLTTQIDSVRQSKADLLSNAKLPLQGLSVVDSELTYKGAKWDCMSGSDQLKVSTAIVRCLNPKCGFVLLDKLEQMDIETLNEFGVWIEEQGLQVIATRVSTGGECSIIIEDGCSVETEEKKVQFTEGEF